MQLALERVVATFGDLAPANDLPAAELPKKPDDTAAVASCDKTHEPKANKPDKRRDPHGRRWLDLTRLPVEVIEVDPDRIAAWCRQYYAGRNGFVRAILSSSGSLSACWRWFSPAPVLCHLGRHRRQCRPRARRFDLRGSPHLFYPGAS
ncbi:hypothetical protein [Sorangium sp. So ce381]|uniref:hypothetical protein n=1 Tax=Sorangium sp. So ce381 TaxID=3133307 RepID=UPI003F5B1CE6